AFYTGDPRTYDFMRDGAQGLRVLGGGLDSGSGDYPARTFNAPRILVQNRVAEAAATFLVYHNEDALGVLVDREDALDGPPTPADLERLARALFSGPSSAQLRDTLRDYVRLADALELVAREPAEVWALTIGAMLRDPLFVTY
ncbi:MAG: hypothetical protein AAGI01_06200, partial [Myxococcota bacterium]